MNKYLKVYNDLLKKYGQQGWWPLIDCRTKNSEDINILYEKGYHPGDYSCPKNEKQKFEICVGAILTQNTAWLNVEKAINNLNEQNLLGPEYIKNKKIGNIREAIKPAGYYNQKSVYLKEFADFYLSLKGRTPDRNDLLNVKGIGPETCDSMLLYAYKVPEFVVDAYTKRIFSSLGYFDISATYNEVKDLFQSNIDRDAALFQEFHALIVVHAKNFYRKKSKITRK
jgi:endonuclease III related protein